MQLEKWKQDKMTTVQYIWAELGAKHVKLGQEQEQLEKLTKLIEKVHNLVSPGMQTLLNYY